MRVLAASILAAAAIGAAPASAGVITFDDFAPQSTCLNPLVTGGLSFAPAGGAICVGVWPLNPVSNNGTPGLTYGYGSLEISKDGGGAFTLEGFDVGISWYSAATTATISYVFDLAAGGTMSGVFDIWQGLATYDFGDASIVKATFSGLGDGYVAIDNVTFDTGPGVPEPAAWALMIAGFGLVGAAARRRRSLVSA